MTKREQLALQIEGCLVLMEEANQRLATVFQRVQEHLLEEGRAATREKAQERMRAKIAPAQKTLSMRREKDREAELDARAEGE